MFTHLRGVATVTGLVLASAALWATPAWADGTSIQVSSDGRGGLWGPTFVPALTYGNPRSVRAAANTTDVVSFTTSGACTVSTVTLGPPTVARLTAQAPSGTCSVTASVPGATSTYDLPMTVGVQTAALGRAFDPNLTATPGRRYLMGDADLTTDQGNPVTFTVKGARGQVCTKVRKGTKVYVRMSLTSAGRSCTVKATAPTTSPDYGVLRQQVTIGIFP